MQPKEGVAKVTVPQIGLLVSKKHGEAALIVLKQFRLISTNYRIRSKNGQLVIPILRRPLATEREALQNQLQDFSLIEATFEARHRTRRSLSEELEGRIPSSLLAEIPESLDIIGDIGVVEVSEKFQDHSKTLAQGILAVNQNLRSVFAKAGPVIGADRVRKLQWLAGEKRTTTIHRETGCRFKVDLAKAYFSPRLSHEHQRVALMVENGERIVDMFAGVGPFSIIIAKQNPLVKVDAIDANPDAVRLLEENVKLNHSDERIHVWHGDAKEVVRRNLAGTASRIIMNHPAWSAKFLQSACEALNPAGGTIHYYTFSEGADCEGKAVTEFEQNLTGCGRMMEMVPRTTRVRGVAPMKWQVVVDARVGPSNSQKSQPSR